jgi:hypothetical protein
MFRTPRSGRDVPQRLCNSGEFAASLNLGAIRCA